MLQRKQTLANDTQQRAAELTAVEARQKDEHNKLLAQREQRKQVLDKISATIGSILLWIAAESFRDRGRPGEPPPYWLDRLVRALADADETSLSRSLKR